VIKIITVEVDHGAPLRLAMVLGSAQDTQIRNGQENITTVLREVAKQAPSAMLTRINIIEPCIRNLSSLSLKQIMRLSIHIKSIAVI
jgi:hypothetical protein